MATTRIIPMHLNKGKTLAQCLADRTEYGMNPDKTEGGALISAFACEPETAVSEFALSKREYRELTGRVQESDVIAYQVRQSFKPGEVTPEEANRIGYEFAKRFLKGRHAFLVCTHTDKKHIHNHIYWNSTALDCTRKFKNFIGSYRAVRRLSDLICAEHRLSVVENPQKHGLSYNKWRGGHDKLSNRDLLRMAIDAALEKQPKDFDALLEEYGEDTGMKNEPNKSRGYLVCEGLSVYEQSFQDAAMALEKVGDVSAELVKTSYGYHILQYATDVTPGAVELTEEIKSDIYSTLLSDAKDAAYESAVTQWVSEADVKTFPKVMK